MANKEKVQNQAEKLVSKGKVEAAIKEYQKIIDDNPNDTNVLNRMGDLYTRVNRMKEAIQVFGRIADHFTEEGFFLRAIAILKKINKLDPSLLEIYEKLGDLYLKQNMPREASSHFQYLADYYIRQDETEKALPIYERIVQMDPENISVMGKLAELFQKAGQAEKALEEYQNIGRMLAKQGHFQEAVKVYQQAIKLDPGNVELAKQLAETLTNQGNSAEALEILQAAARNKPDDPEIVRILLKAFEKEQRFEEALEAVQNALRHSPKEINFYEIKGALLFKMKDVSAGIEALQAAAELSLQLNDTGKGISLLQTIIKKDHQNIPALEKLLEVQTSEGQETYVINTLDNLVEAYLSLNMLDKAEEMAQKLVEREPDNAQHHEKVAYIQSKMGKHPTMDEISRPEEEAEIKAEELEELPEIQIPELQEAPEAPETEGEEASPETSQFINERMVEVDVFLKYGLLDRATEQIEEVINQVPDYIPAYQKLIGIHQQERNIEEMERVGKGLFHIFLKHGEKDEAETLKEQLLSAGVNVSDWDMADLEATKPGVEVELMEESLDLGLEEELGDFIGGFDEQTPEEESKTQKLEALSEEGIEAIDLGEEETLDMEELEAEAIEAPMAPEPQEEVVVEEVPEEEITAEIPKEPAEEIQFEEEAVSASQIPDLAEIEEAGEEEEVMALEPEAILEAEPILDVEPSTSPAPVSETEEDLLPEVDLEAEIEPIAEAKPSKPKKAKPVRPSAIDISIPEVPAPTPHVKAKKKHKVPKVDLDSLSSDLFKKRPAKKTEKAAAPGKISLKSSSVSGLSDLEQLARKVKGKPHKKIKPVDLAEKIAPVIEGEEAAPPPPEPKAPTVEQLGELDFYLDQDLLDEAKKIMDDLLTRFPDDQELTTRKKALDEKFAVASEAAQVVPEKEDGEGLFADEEEFFDLASELEKEIEGEELVTDEIPDEEPSLDDIFKQFKKGVEQQLSSEDYDTHYNLGIAYKEMALLDEAISEFQIASKSPTHLIECCSMLGLCFLEKGMPQLAEKWYRKGLESPTITEDEQMGLMYDLANLHLQIGDTENAYKLFLDIYGTDTNYRDVQDKIHELEETIKTN